MKTKIQYECLYCGYKWMPKQSTSYFYTKEPECAKCGDRDVKQRKFEVIDYYETGSNNAGVRVISDSDDDDGSDFMGSID